MTDSADNGLSDDAAIAALQSALGDRYVVERQIGRGGMATVYLANDTKHDRKVAVKVLNPELAASIGGERFLREIRVAASLNHPHVLGMYDSGATDGELYYVMPYAEGESLRDRLDREKQLSVEEALRIAGEVASALAYAHSRGVIHRDIKPENILITDGHAVVADFGIARAVSAAGSEKLTGTGMAIGTPTYMSPEQGAGMPDINGSADVYSLGCVLYEMLVGEPPYTGPNLLAIMARHSMAEIPSVRVVRSSVPPDVEHIVHKALGKTPADRYVSAADMGKALALAAAHNTASYGATYALPRAPRSRRRNVRAGVVGGGILVLVLAGAAMAWTRLNKAVVPSADAKRIAVTWFEDGSSDHSLGNVADGFTEALAGALQSAPGLVAVSSNATAPFRGTAVTRDSIARALHVSTVVSGIVAPDGSNIRVTLVLNDEHGTEFDRLSFFRPASELLQLRQAVVDSAARLVGTRVGDEIALRATRLSTRSADAWAASQRARQLMRVADSAAVAEDSTTAERADLGADSLLQVAGRFDPKWSEPALLDAQFNYRRSRRFGVDAAYAEPYIARGLIAANRAVAADSSASALEARGLLRYWQYLLKIGSPAPADREKLVADARADLELATTKNPSQASAWSALSHLYINTENTTLADAKLAASRAFQSDAYLPEAVSLLTRLTSLSYELEQFVDARRYCDLINQRAPKDPRGAECDLRLMSTAATRSPSAAMAWTAHARSVSLSPPALRAFNDLYSRVFVAAVLVKADLPDSARHVLAAVERAATPQLDPEQVLRLNAAHVHLMLNERDAAFKQLGQWVAANGDNTSGGADEGNGWWFRDLQGDPRYRKLFGH